MPQRKLSELAVKGLDLEDANSHEHVDEGTRVDKYVGSTRLARDRLSHQSLSSSRVSPQEVPSREVTALRLDFIGLLEEGDVLFDQVKDVILTPDVIEPSLDFLGHDHADASTREEPEDHHELADGDRHDHDD